MRITSTRIPISLFLTIVGFLAAGCQTKQETALTPPDKPSGSEPKAVPPPTEKTRNPYYSRTDTAVLNVSDETWKKILPPDVYAVAREQETERAFTGKYNDFEGIGTYYCVVCGNKLFRSGAKFASTCGWPSFFEPARKDAVLYETDTSYDMVRDEVLCGRCKSHLGHVFDDGPPPTGKRFCMNSVVLDFEPDNPAKSQK
jgi:peptide-methionine (R)-S-oxide reductase